MIRPSDSVARTVNERLLVRFPVAGRVLCPSLLHLVVQCMSELSVYFLFSAMSFTNL